MTSRLDRFYAMSVPALPRDEWLTDITTDDLVAAHLAHNRAYFGVVDKTLAGFVVLDAADDDYLLYDRRGDGGVWKQDHETRALEKQGTLAAWLKRKEPKAKQTAAQAKSAPGAKAKPGLGKRAVSSADLCTRYQWLVWLLAQRQDLPDPSIESPQRMGHAAAQRFYDVWGTVDAAPTALAAELPSLGTDPHLAIYWLLHTAILGMEAERAQVLAAVGGKTVELWQAFVVDFAHLGLADGFRLVPEFAARRSCFLDLLGQGYEQIPSWTLKALAASPGSQGLLRASRVIDALKNGTFSRAEAERGIAGLPDAPGIQALRAYFAKLDGKSEHPAADAVARAVPGAEEHWTIQLDVLNELLPLVRDGEALLAAYRALANRDFHRLILGLAIRAQELLGREVVAPRTELEARVEQSQRTRALVVASGKGGEAWTMALSECPDETVRLLAARRLLLRLDLATPMPEALRWSYDRLLGSGYEGDLVIAAKAFSTLDGDNQGKLLDSFKGVADGPDHPLVRLLLAVLTETAPVGNDMAASYALGRCFKTVLGILSPFAHDPRIFEVVIRLVETSEDRTVVESILERLFSCSDKESVVHRLDAAQAERVARALVAGAFHANIHVRNVSGSKLYYFNHGGAEAFLIKSLIDYGTAYADQRDDGKTYDHGQTHVEMLENVVANLYSATRNLGTPTARRAIAERLFTERREYWRLGSAIGELWTPAYHQELLALLAERRDGCAIGTYAYALADFVKKPEPLCDLLRLLLGGAMPSEARQRSFAKYACIIGAKAGLAVKDYALVRQAWAAAEAISEPPIEGNNESRGNAWKNPFDSDTDLRKALDGALSRDADKKGSMLRAKAAKARAAGKPSLKPTDADLASLAKADVAKRFFHDPRSGELWFLDAAKALRYFDGYDVVPPPMPAALLNQNGWRAFLRAPSDSTSVWCSGTRRARTSPRSCATASG